MRNILAVGRKELRSYFASPIAYIVATVFLVISGLIFFLTTIASGQATLTGLLGTIGIILLFLSPVLTMRLFAEEQSTGTIELLLTAPVRDWEVVIGKYLAALGLLLVMLLLTAYYPILLFVYGSPDVGPLLSGYLGRRSGRRVILIGRIAHVDPDKEPDCGSGGCHRNPYGLLVHQWRRRIRAADRHRGLHSRHRRHRPLSGFIGTHRRDDPRADRVARYRLLPVVHCPVSISLDPLHRNEALALMIGEFWGTVKSIARPAGLLGLIAIFIGFLTDLIAPGLEFEIFEFGAASASRPLLIAGVVLLAVFAVGSWRTSAISFLLPGLDTAPTPSS